MPTIAADALPQSVLLRYWKNVFKQEDHLPGDLMHCIVPQYLHVAKLIHLKVSGLKRKELKDAEKKKATCAALNVFTTE